MCARGRPPGSCTCLLARDTAAPAGDRGRVAGPVRLAQNGSGEIAVDVDVAPARTMRVNIKRTERSHRSVRPGGARIQPYLFLVLEGARLDAGGMRIALSGSQPLCIGRGETREITDTDAARLSVPDPR